MSRPLECRNTNGQGAAFLWIVFKLESHLGVICIHHIERTVLFSHADATCWSHMKGAARKSHENASHFM